jgi:hypothetical protein
MLEPLAVRGDATSDQLGVLSCCDKCKAAMKSIR